MTISEYWTALARWQRAGLLGGVVLILALTGAIAFWVFRDPWVPLASELTSDRLATVSRELTREKFEYRVAADGATIEVRQSSVGKARASAAGGLGLPPTVGLEIFKESDFSTTDFAQRINYQRALQGELARTLQTMAGVRSARVHVVLPEGGVLKRNATRAGAAVTLSMAPGKTLSFAQVRGVQRLVASSIPDIKAEDVVVLDEAGVGLGREATSRDADLSSTQLDMKRQVDAYLESKLTRLLEDIAPGTQVTLSVDATLDYKQLKGTVDEPIAVPRHKSSDPATGVVVKERQTQRVAAVGNQGDAGPESTDMEIEYKVGHRVEHWSLPAGTIRRVNVAVAIRGAPTDLASSSVERLVAHAVGVDKQRGDSVMVLLLGQGVAPLAAAHVLQPPAAPQPQAQRAPPSADFFSAGLSSLSILGAVGLMSLIALLRLRHGRGARDKDQQLSDIAKQVQTWLAEEPKRG
jgi:flagellar M-ring protein FliF